MLKYLLIIIVVFSAYIAIKFVPPNLENGALESMIEQELGKINDKTVLDFNASRVKAFTFNLIKKNSIPVTEEAIGVAWARNGDVITIGIDFEYPYSVSLFGFDGDYTHTVHLEKSVQVDLEEERKKAMIMEERKMQVHERERRRFKAGKEYCESMNGVWDGYMCTITVYD